ncbi:hypothetical protein GJ496_008238 [Pomphorhynchus laevis]|nr:hypothetical protein GJ496_008238 [Pomphorhynchus laevis]
MSISDIYNVVIQWPPSTMNLPQCEASKKFIDIITELYQKICGELPLMDDNILKSATVFFLFTTKRKYGQINELFEEARILQARSIKKKDIHPEQAEVCEDVLLNHPLPRAKEPHSLTFLELGSDSIVRVLKSVSGSAAPSGFDLGIWEKC